MESNIKKIKITGGAAESLLKEPTKTRKRVVRQVPTTVEPRGVPVGGGQPVIVPPAPVPVPVPAPVPTVVQEAGAKSVKVILDPSKRKTKKLVLSPPKHVVKLASGPSVQDQKKRNVKTQKVSRRIHVSVDGLKKRVFRAKTIKKESQKMPIEQLKKELQASGLIKDGSKAPEPILRQMYSDFQVLKQRAL